MLAPILGWVGVALSGSNTSTNAMFGPVQVVTGRLLDLPPLLLPSFNSVGAEVGKPIAPQTASVGVSTSRFVRSEGDVIRHNMGWTLVVLAYLVVIAVAFYSFAPGLMVLPSTRQRGNTCRTIAANLGSPRMPSHRGSRFSQTSQCERSRTAASSAAKARSVSPSPEWMIPTAYNDEA